MITWHVETSAGPRFEYADDEEEMRRQMIDYYNETCRDEDEDEELPEDATFDEAREAIEEYENFSYEEVHESCLPKVFVASFTSDVSVHLSHRTALEWVAKRLNTSIDGMEDDAANTFLADQLGGGDWFNVQEKEIQS